MISILFIVVWIALVALGYFLFSFWYLVPLYLLIGYLGAILFVALILIILLPVMKYTKVDNKFKHYILVQYSKLLNRFLLGISVKATGIENIPKTGKLTVYGNHKSQTDPFIVLHAFNRPLAFTPKISLYKLPVVNKYMEYMGCLPIDREDNRRTAKTMVNAIKQVEDGYAMLIFPEGGIKTRETDQILEIKGGAFKIGTKAESDFLPVSMSNTKDIQNKKWYKRVKIYLHFHPVVKYETVKELTTTELGDLMKEIINSKLKK